MFTPELLESVALANLNGGLGVSEGEERLYEVLDKLAAYLKTTYHGHGDINGICLSTLEFVAAMNGPYGVRTQLANDYVALVLRFEAEVDAFFNHMPLLTTRRHMPCFLCWQSLQLYTCADKPGLFFVLFKSNTPCTPNRDQITMANMPALGLGGHMACLMKCLFVAHAMHSKSQAWYVRPDPNSAELEGMEDMFAPNVRTIFNVNIASQIKFWGACMHPDKKPIFFRLLQNLEEVCRPAGSLTIDLPLGRHDSIHWWLHGP